MTNYKLSGDAQGETLIVIYDHIDPVTVPGTHPKFDEILALLRAGGAEDDEVEVLVNEIMATARKLTYVTERVSVTPYAVLFDGDPLDPALSKYMMELFESGQEEALEAVANFLDKASQNISMDSVTALYDWIENGDLVLRANGNFVAYKGVMRNKNDEVVSITAGKAWVDGIEHTGNIPNPVGAVVSMPRSEVDSDGRTHCSTGLHAGTYKYANDFARGVLLLVEINPRDVVSVPNDYTFSKLRVSRYTVLEHIEGRLETRYYDAPAETDHDFEEYDEENYYYVPEEYDEDDIEGEGEDSSLDITSDMLAVTNTLQGFMIVDGGVNTATVVGNLGDQIEAAVSKTIEDNFGKRGPDGKFVKGGTVKMKRDEKGHFISDKKAKKQAKKDKKAKKKGENK